MFKENVNDKATSCTAIGKRHGGNTATKEVHDLDNETVQCQIDAILESGHALPLRSLERARQLGYYNCQYCLGGSSRSALSNP